MKKKSISTKPSDRTAGPRTLAVDVGGTGVKAMVLDLRGKPLTDRVRMPTPKNCTPKALLGVIRKLAKRSGEYDRVAVGFPGVIKDGLTYTAPNLGKGWKGYKLEQDLSRVLKRPTRIANDADVQGLGCVSGRGIELVITLGTGVGSVLFASGQRIHLELAHHPFHKGKSYEDELGHRALLKKGKGKWNKLLLEAVSDLKNAFNYDRLYLGGGDSKFIKVKLPGEVTIVSNVDGLLGAIALWKEDKPRTVRRRRVKRAELKVAKKVEAGAVAPKPAPAPGAQTSPVNAPTRMPSPSRPRRVAAPQVPQIAPAAPTIG